jgi:hypothetical protein
MQLEVSVEKLREFKLFVATPMYGGMNHGMYMKSCLDLQAICSQYGIEIRYSFIFNESLITRARNYLVDEFLRAEGFTHLLFIDADIHFDPRDVIACLALDKDVVGGPYPKKSIKWASVKEGVKKHPDIEPGDMEKLAGDFVFNPVPGTEKFSVAEPVEVLEIGTGFMMVKRHVFDKFREAYPEFSYRPDHVGQANFDGQRYIHAYFDTVIDRKRKVVVNGEEREFGGSDRYLSEDYMFCQWWRNIGGQIWLCPWMKTHHIGTYAFTGDMPAVANFVGSL